MLFHVYNRGVERRQIFAQKEDYSAFIKIIEETLEKIPIRICAYCIMPNHWHFVIRTIEEGDLSKFIHRLTNTHVRRWKQYRNDVGSGHLYQGRYHSIPVGSERYARTLLRYVERNPLSSGLVRQAEDWKWSSLWRRESGTEARFPILSPWPFDRPSNWVEEVNQGGVPDDLELQLEMCLKRGRPFGDPEWAKGVAEALGLEQTLSLPRGQS